MLHLQFDFDPLPEQDDRTLRGLFLDGRSAGFSVQTSEVWKPSEVSVTLTFEPVQPLARRVTLHVPAVAATLPGTAAFDVTVPDGVAIVPHPDRPPVSAPWSVDVSVEMTGRSRDLCRTARTIPRRTERHRRGRGGALATDLGSSRLMQGGLLHLRATLIFCNSQ